MKAGFAKERITPPLGTRMMGFGQRDERMGCQSVHDDLFVRALHVEHGGEQALLAGFDLCFVGREDSHRFKGALGARFGLSPRQILLNASHTHGGAASGRWYAGDFLPTDPVYLRELQEALLRAVSRARQASVEVEIAAATGRSRLPMNRRRLNANGRSENRPNPTGTVCDALPVCRLADARGQTVCLMFSTSAHPSAQGQFAITADYPGVAMRQLDAHLGDEASLFLQGMAGDAKTRVCGEGRDTWRQDVWEDSEKGGELLAREVLARMEQGLRPVEPTVRSALVEMEWPLAPPPARATFEAIAGDQEQDAMKRRWARRQVEWMDRHGALPSRWPVFAQAIQLGAGLRLIALEGEPVAAHGRSVLDAFREGVTLPLGYSNGEGLYLATSEMLPQGGMEVESYWEYGPPSPLAPGMEAILARTLEAFRRSGIE
ncbi:MAG: hypothetical protein IT578_00050 [Verrucomicrobiae bacterium]|nr:hypothetical protein [Verrucomicrobiae bacterium]